MPPICTAPPVMKTKRSMPGDKPRQRGHGLRPLQCEQGMVGHRQHLAARTDPRLDVRDVGHLAGAVDDDEQRVVALVEEHQVVEDAAFVVQQQAVALLARRQADHVDRHQALEGGGGIGARPGAAGPCGRCRTGRPPRACACARPSGRRGTAPASSSPRRAPCGRRAPGAGRGAGSFADRRKWRPRHSPKGQSRSMALLPWATPAVRFT